MYVHCTKFRASMKYKQDTKQESRKGRNYNDKQKRKELYQNIFSLSLDGRTRGNFYSQSLLYYPSFKNCVTLKSFLID